MAHSTEIVDFVGLNLLNDTNKVGGVGQISVMQNKVRIVDVWILIQVVYPIGVEQRSPSLDAVHFVAFV